MIHTLSQTSLPTLVIATHNRGKSKEIRTILRSVGWNLLSLDDFEQVGEAPENENSFEGNALSKAKFYAAATGSWVLADDSGLEVDELDGAPGVHSARYAGDNATDAERRAKLLQEMISFTVVRRKARFVCVCAVVTSDLKIFAVTRGICPGTIVKEARGSSGFGYDPIFQPEGFAETFGELSESVKNQISHRAKALIEMRKLLLR